MLGLRPRGLSSEQEDGEAKGGSSESPQAEEEQGCP